MYGHVWAYLSFGYAQAYIVSALSVAPHFFVVKLIQSFSLKKNVSNYLINLILEVWSKFDCDFDL